jgi:hypothetical protein
MYRHWQPVLRMYITPFMTARMSVRRLPPPRLAGGINGGLALFEAQLRAWNGDAIPGNALSRPSLIIL